MNNLDGKKVGFIGGGKMAEAIFRGMLSSSLVPPSDLYVCNRSSDRLEFLEKEYKVKTVLNKNEDHNEGAREIIDECDVIVLSIEPNGVRELLEDIGKKADEKRKLFISIIGGADLKLLQSFIKKSPVVRVMPNTPMLAGSGIAGIVAGKEAQKEDMDTVVRIFSSVGKTYIFSENMMDPFTGVSGCGPAFASLFIEALSDGGVKMGLPRKTAQELAAQVLIGTGKMVLENNLHPAVLKDNVCTPGGGTIAGVAALEEGAFRSDVINAVEKAVLKMQDLGKKI